MTLGDLRASAPLTLTLAETAKRLQLGTVALAKLEATRIDRVSVATLTGYCAALGAKVSVTFPVTGHQVDL